MDKEKELSINVVPNQHGEVHIFHHQGPEPVKTKQPQQIKIDGEIKAPLLFQQNRDYSPELAVVTFSEKELWIKFEADPTDPLAAEVIGRLKEHEDYKAFEINSDSYFTKDALQRLIREKVHCFESAKEAKALEIKLRNFAAKIEKEIKESDDQKGNSAAAISRNLSVDKEILKTRKLTFPIFIGGSKQTLDVEIVVHPERVAFGFQCWELNDILESEKKQNFWSVVDELHQKFTVIQVG